MKPIEQKFPTASPVGWRSSDRRDSLKKIIRTQRFWYVLVSIAILGGSLFGMHRMAARVDAGANMHDAPADLSLTKVTGGRPLGGYRSGYQVAFQLTVANASRCNRDNALVECAPASSVTVKDVLPSGLKFVAAEPANVYNPSTGIWTVGRLSAGAQASLVLIAQIGEGVEGNITNYAQVWTASPGDQDSTPGDNSTDEDDDASVTINVVAVKSSLAGNVYVDDNDNGKRDQNEEGIGNVKIQLTGTDNQGTPISLTAMTLPNGSYQFSGLNPGIYKLVEMQPENYLDGRDSAGSAGGTVSNDQISNIHLGSGIAATGYDFGERQMPQTSISGNVYVDANDNGVRDQAEAGIGGVKITLVGVDTNGVALSRVTNTLSNGTYVFTQLPAGVYKVSETQPDGFIDGKDAAGSAGGTVSNDMISNISLGARVAAVNYNFGERTGLIDVAISKSHVGDFTEGAVESYTIRVTNTGNLATKGDITVTDYLPSGMTYVSGTGNGWICTSADDRRVVCARTDDLAPSESTTISLRVDLADRMLSQVVNMAVVATPGDSVESNNTAKDPTNIKPAPLPQPPNPCDANGGSVLLFPLYSSDAANNRNENTRFTLTNTNINTKVVVHLFLVDGASCTTSDAYVCLTQNQTATFLASDLDPGTTGYVVAVATNDQGCPISFNHLIGQADVRLASGHSGSYLAEQFRALYSGTLPGCDGNTAFASIGLDGVNYEAPASQLAVPVLGSLADGNNPLLVLVRTGGNLGIGAFPLGSIFGVLYNDRENAFSFSFSSTACQFRQALTADFPRTAPRMNVVIPAGQTGWMRLGPMSGNGVAGLLFNTNTNANNLGSIFNSGVNLPKIRCGTDSYTVPVFPPSC